MDCSTPGFSVHHQVPEPTQTHVHPTTCHRPLLLPPSIFPSIRVFPNESVRPIRWPKYWSFSCSISPSNEYSGLISFRMDWLDLLAVQGTLKSILQHHSSKASILRQSEPMPGSERTPTPRRGRRRVPPGTQPHPVRPPWLPLETRPDSPGEPGCNPEIPAFPGEEE